MRGRAFVLILCFWAVLMVVTPALIKLSANAKLNGEFYVVVSESEGDGEAKNDKISASLLSRKALVAAVPRKAPSPAPAPAPAPAAEKRHFWREKLMNLRR
nr:uncharacterized protein LOC104221766 [Ipomoea trifida]